MTDRVSQKNNRAHGADALGANAEIGRKLKQYYESLIVEEVPDRFAQLLNQLDSAEAKIAKD